MKLDIQKALEYLQPNGPLAHHLKEYETRPEQLEMMRAVLQAYNEKEIALIEAGTGTGKSMAYLIPAILWAVENKERTVISTNTIALQEQLLHKDIPLLKKILGVDLKAVLVKGMGNYLCKRKLDDSMYELRLMSERESKDLQQIGDWSHSTKDGSRASLPMIPSSATWEKVCAESDTCNGKQCSFYHDCHFIKARKRAEDAQILIVNHSLLFADLAMKTLDNEEEGREPSQGILPPYTRIVLDEAHEIEETATTFFAARASQYQMMKFIGRIGTEKHGKLTALGKILSMFLKQIPENDMLEISNRLSIDIPGTRRELLQQIVDTFNAFEQFVYSISFNKVEDRIKKMRILPQHQQHKIWIEDVIPVVEQLINTLERYVSALNQVNKNIQSLENEKVADQTKGIRFEIMALGNRLLDTSRVLKDFIQSTPNATTVRWIESDIINHMPNVTLYDAPLDISEALVNALFSRAPTVILCSATMTTNRTFDFIRKRLGLTTEKLPNRKVTEHLFASPFDFKKQAMLAVPIDLPNPTEQSYSDAVTEKIWESIQASRGNAFVLFTSYQMMQKCFKDLEERMKRHRYVAFKQGDDHRKSLLDRFKTTDYSVLFGTDSFWQGIDVVGEALRCVIITKLPFKVPTEPIIQARTEAIQAAGGDAFMEYAIPTAIVKFKQGFGRLIRNKKDRGCIVCLDPRLVRKGYGKLFLNSLPACEQIFPENGALKDQMSDFYRKTYHLTKRK